MKISKIIAYIIAQLLRAWVTAMAAIAIYCPMSALAYAERGYLAVGGYAERHATGKLTIMFLRRKSAPDEPYYTMEVSNDYKIVQCRGYKNNWVTNGGQEKPQEIINVEKKYQQYLDGIAAKKSKTKSRRKTA